MNRRAYMLVLLVCTTCAVTVDSFAKTPVGGDNFDDNSLSPQDWLVPLTPLVNADQHLEYLSTGISPTDAKSVTWASYVDQDLSWTYRIDVSMPSLALSGDQFVLYGLEVDGTDGSHVFSYLAQFVDADTGEVRREIVASTSGATPSVAATNDIATVQLQYDAPSHTMSAEYDANGPVGGYSFTRLASQTNFDPTNVSVIGQSSGRVVVTAAQHVYGDNAQAAVVPEPSLYAFALSGICLLGWLGRRARTRDWRVTACTAGRPGYTALHVA